MRRRPESASKTTCEEASSLVWLMLFAVIISSFWAVHYYQFQNLPVPLSAQQAGKGEFSEEEAMKHVVALTEFGPHSVGSDALKRAVEYIFLAAEEIKSNAHMEVVVEVDLFHAKFGVNRLGGKFKGMSFVYSDLSHVVLRILPKDASEAAGENAILVSSHIDTVFSTGGTGDCSSCVGVILELARATSQWAHGFKNGVIFLLNTGEEEGLNGAHSFITQHRWRHTIRMAVDLEAMGIGGKSTIFQAGPHPWAIENFARVAKYPSAQITAQDLFNAGIINSATDFQVYKEVANLSGLDFAYTDYTAVYHTKNDNLKMLKAGSLQHLGDNMLAFLNHTAASPHFPKGKAMDVDENDEYPVFFDILGRYLMVYSQDFATILHSSVICISLLIWTGSLLMGGFDDAVALSLSCLSIILMWIFSLSFSFLVAFVLPRISSSPLPYVASPCLVLGLFAAPAFLGAFLGQHLGFHILRKFLSSVNSNKLSPAIEAERWLFKAGFVQWLIILIVGTCFNIGSSYLALVWLVSPAFAYGFLEATLYPVRPPRPLKIVTLIMSLMVPILISGGTFIDLAGTLIGTLVRSDSKSPGSTPEWMGNVTVAAYISAVICLTLVYLLSYLHLSGRKKYIILAMCALFGLSVVAVMSGTVPPFTDDIARPVHVVHVVDTRGGYGENEELISSYISMFSVSPGMLIKEVEQMEDEFVCGKDEDGTGPDFVTFSVEYGCRSYGEAESGWSESDIPSLQHVHVSNDTNVDDDDGDRTTLILVDTKLSKRWSLAINAEEIQGFNLTASSDDLVVPRSFNMSSVDGWHIIRFSGGENAPTQFNLTLFWKENSMSLSSSENQHDLLVKLRTDVDRVTPKTERVLKRLPSWCAQFGKSSSPPTLAFLASLPVKSELLFTT